MATEKLAPSHRKVAIHGDQNNPAPSHHEIATHGDHHALHATSFTMLRGSIAGEVWLRPLRLER